jgi:amino acid transporter
MSVGWIVVSFFTICISISMAEIVSAIPTAGGPYYWAAILAPAKHSAFASWITGWYISFSPTLLDQPRLQKVLTRLA